jgi:fructokinase
VRIGIDLGGTKIEGVALDDDGVELARKRVATPRGEYDATVAAVADVVEMLEHAADGQGSVGIGMPGALSRVTGLVKNANSVWLIGRPLQQDLQARLGRPVRLANDANCFALSEASDGAAAGAEVVFGVILGTGVGGGVVVNGRVLTGPNAIAGEWGHNPLPWPDDDEHPGPACYCGRSGCVETFLSGPGIAADLERRAGIRRNPEDIAAHARLGDAAAGAALLRYENRLAKALAAVINVLDPDVIVAGGGMSNVMRLYDAVPPLWGRYVFSDAIQTRFVPAKHGDASGVRGAAWLWPAGGR